MQLYSKLHLLKSVVGCVFVCVISKVSTIQQALLLQIREPILFAQRPSCTRKLVSFGKGAVHGSACLEFLHFGGGWTGSLEVRKKIHNNKYY